MGVGQNREAPVARRSGSESPLVNIVNDEYGGLPILGFPRPWVGMKGGRNERRSLERREGRNFGKHRVSCLRERGEDEI